MMSFASGRLRATVERDYVLAHVLEAMTSDRPYQPGMTVAAAIAELRACSGIQFDPMVVEALDRMVGEHRLTVMALRAASPA